MAPDLPRVTSWTRHLDFHDMDRRTVETTPSGGGGASLTYRAENDLRVSYRAWAVCTRYWRAREFQEPGMRGLEAGRWDAHGPALFPGAGAAFTSARRARDRHKQDRWKSHEAKKGYRTFVDAEAAAERYNQRVALRFGRMQPYPCRHCQYFHIGHAREEVEMTEPAKVAGMAEQVARYLRTEYQAKKHGGFDIYKDERISVSLDTYVPNVAVRLVVDQCWIDG